MIALPKLALLILLLLGVWYALRWFNRPAPKTARRGPAQWTRAAPDQRSRAVVEDLIACSACGAYVAASARGCGKAGCPRPA